MYHFQYFGDINNLFYKKSNHYFIKYIFIVRILVEKKEKKQKKPFSRTLKDVIYRRVHILSWLPSYDREAAVSDMIAGITIGLTLIPQSIAYAALAGLTAQYGLYSAFMGMHIYFFIYICISV